MRVVVSGASGLVGSALCRDLRRDDIEVVRLVRRAATAPDERTWDPAGSSLDPEVIAGADAVVNLNGVSIGARRWSEAQKQAILDSRVASTAMLANAIAQLEPAPSAFVSASAVGYYGAHGDELVDEATPAGDDFLAQVCRQWEAATTPASEAGVRTVLLRSGVVLTDEGPPLTRMLLPFKLGLGGKIAGGQQWMSWIALRDAIAVIRFAIEASELVGPVNSTAPQPVRQAEFARVLAAVLGRPAFLPTPVFALQAIYGRELVQHLLVEGQRVVPAALETAGFEFSLGDLESALRDILGR